MNKYAAFILVVLLAAIGGQTAYAQETSTENATNESPNTEAPVSEEEDKTTTWSVNGGDLFQFDSDIKGGGSFSVNRFFLGGGVAYKVTPSLTLDLNVGFEVDSYNFSGRGQFTDVANGTPWTSTVDVTLKALARWKLDDSWRIFLGGLVSWAGETNAPVSDSFTGGGLMGFAYTFSEDLTLGAGVQISTRLEDNLLFIPSPIIDWRITKQLYISNVRSPVTFPASLGVEVIYYLSYETNISIGSRYEYRRFRLDDSGPAAIQNGVGVDSGFPLWLRFEWRPVSGVRLHFVAGVELGERLELDDRNGNGIADQDVDPAPFVGFFLGFEF